MADADIEAAEAAVSQSPASSPVAELRGILSGALREVFWGFAENVVLGFVSAVWVHYCAFLVSPLACVEGAAIVEAFFVAGGLIFLGFFAFFSVAAIGFILFIGFIVLLLLLLRCRWVRNLEAAEIGGDGGDRIPAAAQRRGPESAGACGRQKAFYCALAVLLLATIAVGLLLLPMPLPATGYCGDGVCSVPMNIRCFPNSIAVLLRHFTIFFVKR